MSQLGGESGTRKPLHEETSRKNLEGEKTASTLCTGELSLLGLD